MSRIGLAAMLAALMMTLAGCACGGEDDGKEQAKSGEIAPDSSAKAGAESPGKEKFGFDPDAQAKREAMPVSTKVVEPPPTPKKKDEWQEPDPQCKKDCASIGYCRLKDGECVVGGAADCKQSTLCINSGGCSAKSFTNEDGTVSYTCAALTDDDCKGSKICKDKGACKVIDGFCTNPVDPKLRKETLDGFAKLFPKLIRACEKDKIRAVRQLRQGGLKSLAGQAWERASTPGLLSPEGLRFVQAEKRAINQARMLWENQLDTNKELMGPTCYDRWKEISHQGFMDCVGKSKRQDLKWLKKAVPPKVCKQ